MGSTQVVIDKHLNSAGECFMFLRWVESTMNDFLVLTDADEEMRKRYNEVFGSGEHPELFARKRLEMSRRSFKQIKNQFLCKWPTWKNHGDVLESIERVEIYRNGFAHANIQLSRPFLLYTPNRGIWKSIKENMKCRECRKYLKTCKCSNSNFAKPRSLVFRCLDNEFLTSFYGDIKTIDLDCFVPTARILNISYQGVAWPEESEYVIGENRPYLPA